MIINYKYLILLYEYRTITLSGNRQVCSRSDIINFSWLIVSLICRRLYLAGGPSLFIRWVQFWIGVSKYELNVSVYVCVGGYFVIPSGVVCLKFKLKFACPDCTIGMDWINISDRWKVNWKWTIIKSSLADKHRPLQISGYIIR